METLLIGLEKETESFDPSGDYQKLAAFQQQAKEWKTLLDQKGVLDGQARKLEEEARHFASRVTELLAFLPPEYPDFEQWMAAQKEIIKKQELEKEKLIEKKRCKTTRMPSEKGSHVPYVAPWPTLNR